MIAAFRCRYIEADTIIDQPCAAARGVSARVTMSIAMHEHGARR